jgi:Domain of unknown function (DUF4406)
MTNPMQIEDGTVYVAGPIRNQVLNNVPAFEDAVEKLNALGYKTINPHNIFEGMDVSEYKQKDYMKRCISYMAMCDVVVTLPNWENSEGATEEVDIARRMGKEIIHYSKIASVNVA